MPIKISTSNSKLGVIPSVNLPPVVTCRKDAPCVKDCYARKGRFRFRTVVDNMDLNYALYQSYPDEYFKEIKKFLNNGFISYAYFRWHAAGDIVDSSYFKGMVKVAEELPHTSFLAFTKKFEIVNEYIKNGGKIPENLNIVFSAWGADFKLSNPYNFPVSHVRFKDPGRNIEIPSSAAECSGNCSECLYCWTIKHGESVAFNAH